MGELKGKTVIVTGGSSGIGQAIALRYAAAGANIVIATKDLPENIKTTGDQIVAAGGQTLVLSVDVYSGPQKLDRLSCLLHAT